MECVIIGGGPSVTQDQIARVLDWRTKAKTRHIFAVDKVFEEVPTSDYCFSRDTKFLHAYAYELENFKGQVIVGNTCFTPEWAEVHKADAYISGAACIQAAAHMGHLLIYLIGADGHHKGGEHWLTNYVNLKNAPNYEKFDSYYADALQTVTGIDVYNLSPGTAIESVPTMEFDEVM